MDINFNRLRDIVTFPSAVNELLMRVLMDNADRGDYFKTCITCTNWRHETELCGLYKQRPPARIIASGCESYNDEIPF